MFTKEIMPAELASWTTIKSYLERNKEEIKDANNAEVVHYIMPIFKHTITNDPAIMMQFHRWLDMYISANLRVIINASIDKLVDADLNEHKIKVVLGMRGPMSHDNLIEFIRANINEHTVKEIGKHKDFPQDAKDILYEKHNDIAYLPQEAVDIFVF